MSGKEGKNAGWREGVPPTKRVRGALARAEKGGSLSFEPGVPPDGVSSDSLAKREVIMNERTAGHCGVP